MNRTFDAEAAVLGACLLVPQAYWTVADLLGADDFAGDAYRALWGAIETLARSGAAIDVVTVADRNPRLATLAYEVASSTASAANVRTYAEIVSREAIARRVRAAGLRISKLAGKDALPEGQSILAACAPRVASAIKPVRDFLGKSVEVMAQRCEATEELTGLPTSIGALDEITSGWQRSDLILIGARPSVGKTALALQCSLHAAKLGQPVLFLSMEMAGVQLADRLVSHEARVDMQNIRQPKRVDESGWASIGRASEVIQGLPLWVDESSALTLEGVCARVRQADATQRLGLVVIDYLTMMTPPRAESITNAWQAVTRGLKALAKDVRVPVVLLSQFNREAARGEPGLHSFRDTGALEQDADVAILLHRPDEQRRDLVKCNVAKQRNGATGVVWLHFDGATGTFTETDERPESVVRKLNRGYGRPLPNYVGDAA